MAVNVPILEFSRGQGINGSDNQFGGFVVNYVSRELKDSFGAVNDEPGVKAAGAKGCHEI